MVYEAHTEHSTRYLYPPTTNTEVNRKRFHADAQNRIQPCHIYYVKDVAYLQGDKCSHRQFGNYHIYRNMVIIISSALDATTNMLTRCTTFMGTRMTWLCPLK
ncbi:hypothetical protein NPIL_443011 [Nephila pilipes]|uniref:Uncharacterized protein n=1 Tax=Nephila pilipes TaxID=299642 RepID=A0A8X6TKU9_NEPPI|nr:hypothetical protein NPIL_443011 [Nephila pilipes]